MQNFFFGNIQFSEGMWNVKMSGRPDGLFGVAQIMLCVNENSKAKVPATAALYPFCFYRQGPLSKEKGTADNDHIRCIKNVRRRSIRKVQKDSPTVVSATSATASVSARDRSFKGLFRPLYTSSEFSQQKLGTLQGAPKSELATEMSTTSQSDQSTSKNICVSRRHTNIKCMAPES